MNGICFECDEYKEVEEHHVIPVSLGGTKTVNLCLKCHMLVHDSLDNRKDSHVALIRNGLIRAKINGKKLGRKIGGMPKNDLLFKHQEIVDLLKKGNSIRKITEIRNVGKSTVQRVCKALKSIA